MSDTWLLPITFALILTALAYLGLEALVDPFLSSFPTH